MRAGRSTEVGQIVAAIFPDVRKPHRHLGIVRLRSSSPYAYPARFERYPVSSLRLLSSARYHPF